MKKVAVHLAERRARLFLTRPISGGLLAASVASVLFALWQHRRMQKKSAVAEGAADF